MGLLTVLVTLFGYLREAALASRFGVSATMDAYFAAIFIPSTIYFLLIAGTVSPVFISILVHENALEDRARGSYVFSNVTNFVLLVLLVTTSAGMLTARAWLPLLFSGFNPGTLDLAVRLTRLILPAVILLALSGILTAVLNSFHKFAQAAFAPAWASIIVIAGVLFARGEKAIYVVGIATVIGFSLQGLVLIPAAASLGIRYRAVLKLRDPAIKKLLRLGVPLLAYLAVGSVCVFVERNLASKLSAGAVSIVTYALRLFVVPGTFLATPLATVAYPQFAQEALREGRGNLADQVSRTLRLAVFVFLPITAWMVLNSVPVTRVLYERGHFGLGDSLSTAGVLEFYSLGILPNAIAIVLLRCFFSVQDTVTPLLAEIIDLAYYLIAAPLLSRRFGLNGLAAARAGSFFIVAAVLLFVLWKRLRLLKLDSDFLRFLLKTVAASLVTALVTWASVHLLQSPFDSGRVWLRLGIVILTFAVSAAVFLAITRALRMSEATQILATVRGLMRRADIP